MRGAMMGRAWVVVGVAGLGVPAAVRAGPLYEMEVALTFDRTSIGIGETAVATMTASWIDLSGWYLSSVNVDLIAYGAFVTVSDIAPVAWNNPSLGFNGQGVASGADIIGLQASQFSLIPPYTADNPILITTFVVTGIAEGSLAYHSTNTAGAPFPYSIGRPFGSVEFGNEVFVSQTLVVTPGPGVVGVMVVAGVGGIGRRRR